MTNPVKILLIEDSEDDEILLLRELTRSGLNFTCARITTEDQLLVRLADEKWDIVISDYNIGAFNGLDALKVIKNKNPELPFILVSGTVGEEIAVLAMRTGAQDYIMKDSTARLAPAIARELAESENRRQNQIAFAAKEEELRHAQKLEAIGQLAGGLAHDFNNILGIIGLYTEKVRSQTNDDEVHKSLNGIFNAHQRGTKLIRQLLTIGKKHAFEAKIFDLSSAVQKIVEIMTVGLGHEHELILEMAPEPVEILGDRIQIEQVLMNFIINARDAMTEPGKVTIQTSLQSNLGEKKVLLSFSDTGCGMDEATLKRTFEPFFTTKEVGKGSGMGLATVMAIIKQHDGEISVSSELNRGTKFNILFPHQEQIL